MDTDRGQRTTKQRLDDALDALDHIERTALSSRTQSRRLRWIAVRARNGIDGESNWQDVELPRKAHSVCDERLKNVKAIKDLQDEVARLKEDNASLRKDLSLAREMVWP